MSDARDHRIAALEAELAALRAEMQDYTYTVSHDLRAPLRHILSYAQLTQEEAGPALGEEVGGFLQTISDSAQHLASLLDGLTELSRLSTAPLQWETVHLAQLVPNVWADVAQRHPARQPQWDIAQPLPEVLVDAALLRRALHCLLDNALKFSTQREVPTITIRAELLTVADMPMVALTIQDNGAGFNPAMQERLFKPFQRLHTTRQFPGIGMGLALTRKIAQRLNGTVTLEGVLDAGCQARLVLPAAARCAASPA